MSRLNNWFIQTECDCNIPKKYFEDTPTILYEYNGISYGYGCIYSQGLINGDGTFTFILNNDIDRNNPHLTEYGVGDGSGNSNGFGCCYTILD